MPMSAIQVKKLRTLISDRTGIAISDVKDYLIEARVSRVLRELKLPDPNLLIAGLAKGDRDYWRCMVAHVTTGHTFFMREPEHFAFLLAEIRRLHRQEICIWVAACSSGEEVYSIAMTLREAGIQDFRIMATDIKHSFLVQLKQGYYALARFGGVPDAWRDRYFDRTATNPAGEACYQARPELRSRVMARNLNLLDPLRFEVAFDFIFCRNVLMYFSHETQSKVLLTLLDNLRPSGSLFIGQSENLLGMSANLVSPLPGVYQKKDRHEKETRSDHR